MLDFCSRDLTAVKVMYNRKEGSKNSVTFVYIPYDSGSSLPAKELSFKSKKLTPYIEIHRDPKKTDWIRLT